MNQQMPQGEGQRRVEVGLDGKPFEVWEPDPQPLPATTPPPSATDWVDGSYYPRGTAETAMLQTPRRSMEFNHYAWYSIGLAGFATSGAIVLWLIDRPGRLPIIWFALAGAGAYYGMRAHNAGVRGFCTNAGLGRAGLAISLLVVVALVVDLLRAFVFAASL
ncbi:hypothetical protein [Demequina lutea]|uniref:Uncharacterized protein n=1 Tax=Demequina lutea TaxID=431489 RepID=A0A7Y9ZDD3_9MICO|nr:hypothetical protein [Demequina lutea]NYI42785.1 hypothetical protein [Demequina lutea]